MDEILTNGDYLIDVTLSGGSGRADVKSPTELNYTDGAVTARIEWSSPNYDYMKVYDKEYYPVNEGGNSVFEIDISGLEESLPITAQTTAMSEPHMIDYTLDFDWDSLQYANLPHTSAVWVCCIGAVLAIGAAGAFIKRRYNNAHK